MKKIIVSIIICMVAGYSLLAQTKYNIGAGYFGQTLTHPGSVVELEIERSFSEKASLPIRADIGFYVHPRYQTGTFLDLSIGFRQYSASGLFIEESVGIGVLQAFLNSDAVYEVNAEGTVIEGSRILPADLMPSFTLGFGYNLTKHSEKQNLVWVRPKIYWQIPHKNSANYGLALQVGYSRTISSK